MASLTWSLPHLQLTKYGVLVGHTGARIVFDPNVGALMDGKRADGIHRIKAGAEPNGRVGYFATGISPPEEITTPVFSHRFASRLISALTDPSQNCQFRVSTLYKAGAMDFGDGIEMFAVSLYRSHGLAAVVYARRRAADLAGARDREGREVWIKVAEWIAIIARNQNS